MKPLQKHSVQQMNELSAMGRAPYRKPLASSARVVRRCVSNLLDRKNCHEVLVKYLLGKI